MALFGTAIFALSFLLQSCGDKNGGLSYKKVAVERGDIAVEIMSTGVVKPENRLEIKPPIAGRVEEVRVSSIERAALIDAARARGKDEVKRWEEFYKATPVLAPIDGTIILRAVEPGQSFTSSDAVLVMSDRLTVKAQVDETDIAKIRVGQTATVLLDAYPDQLVPARVDKVAYDATTLNNVTTYIVDVLPVETPDFMRSGMTANVNFAVDKKENVILLPVSAVKKSGGKSFVKVPSNGSFEDSKDKEVTLGITNGKVIEVVSGVTDKDFILILKPNSLDKESGTTPLFSPPKPRTKK